MVWLVGLPQRPQRCAINEGLGLLFRRADRIRSWEDPLGSRSYWKERKGAGVGRAAWRHDL